MTRPDKLQEGRQRFWWITAISIMALSIVAIGSDHIASLQIHGWHNWFHSLHLVSMIGLTIIIIIVLANHISRQQLVVLPLEKDEKERGLEGGHDQLLTGLHDSSIWLIKLRWIAIAGISVVIYFSTSVFQMLLLDVHHLLWMGLAVMVVVNIIFTVLEAHFSRPRFMVFIQSVFDLSILTYLIYFSGGIHNPFVLFYTFHIIIAGFLLSAKRAYLIAALASIFVVSMTTLQVLSILPLYSIKFVVNSSGKIVDLHQLQHSYAGSSYVHAGRSIAFVGTMFLLCLFTTTIARRLRGEQTKSKELTGSLQLNINQLQSAEKTISLEKNKLSAFIQSMNDGVVFIDNRGEVSLWNSSGRLVWEAKEELGRPFGNDHDKSRDKSPHTAQGADVWENKGSRSHTIKIGEHTYENRFAPVHSDQGDYLGTVLVSRDVTDRLRAEAEMAHHEQMTALGRMAAGVSHEVGNPLSSLLSQIYLLEEEGNDKNILDESVRVLKNEIGRISRIVRSMSEFARPQVSEWAPISINNIIKETVEFLRLEKKAQRITVNFDFDPEIPQILVSKDQIKQVVLNICLNALDSMSDGESISITTGHTDEEVWALFRDTGCGIPQDLIGKIFDPFFTTKEPGKGTGLGLSISDTVIRAHGGRMEVESRVGVGTEFKIILPLRKPSDPLNNDEDKGSEYERQNSHN